VKASQGGQSRARKQALGKPQTLEEFLRVAGLPLGNEAIAFIAMIPRSWRFLFLERRRPRAAAGEEGSDQAGRIGDEIGNMAGDGVCGLTGGRG